MDRHAESRSCHLDLEMVVLEIFDRLPFETQPAFVAEVECGDGSFLKAVHELIKNRSARGRVLDQYPLRCVGVEASDVLRPHAKKTLTSFDSTCLEGDLENPQRLLSGLKGLGADRDDTLYLWSVAVDDVGSLTRPDDKLVIRPRLDESDNFQSWAHLIGRHGLIQWTHPSTRSPCSENQSIVIGGDARTDEGSVHTAWSESAGSRFMMAAAAGLFSRLQSNLNRTATSCASLCRVDHWQRKSYSVRCARVSDVSALIELEQRCWRAGTRAPAKTLLRRIHRYPEGQLVLEVDGALKGCVYSQKIESLEVLSGVSAADVERLHVPSGSVVELLALNILPEVQDQRLGDQLLEIMLRRCALLTDVHTVAGITRCKDYRKHAYLPMEEYIELRNRHGELTDTVLRLHERHGARISRLVPQYRPADSENEGYGVLVVYDNHLRTRPHSSCSSRSQDGEATQAIPADRSGIDSFVVEVIGQTAELPQEAVDRDQPLMEMGLDSADLMELTASIGHRFGLSLPTLFFYQNNTTNKVISAIQDLVEESSRTVLSGEGSPSIEIAVEEARRSQERSLEIHQELHEEIAVIGAACRLPGKIRSLDEFWKLLIDADSAIAEISNDRWTWPAGIDPNGEHAGIAQGGFVDHISEFDAAFFRISPREAEHMDPQQRILLELSWQCMEDAGYSSARLAGSKTGVFVGASGSDYRLHIDRMGVGVEAYSGLSTAMSLLTNRISYFHDLRGPSLQIDTACSSSLVAVHEAVQSLRRGVCTQALVAGINIMCDSSVTVAYYRAGMLSKGGRCRTFDASADGYVRGEGAVVLLLKRLHAAQRDCDDIRAILKGSAVNHGGMSAGLTVPNPTAQAELLIEAYRDARVSIRSVGYIEAHGSATSMGDPIEMDGLKVAFQRSTDSPQRSATRCVVGSVKTNLGHLEAAAGIVGLLK